MSNNSYPLLKSTAVMELLGNRDRSSFWCAVHRHSVPHVRLNARNIKFPEPALRDWIKRRSVGLCPN